MPQPVLTNTQKIATLLISLGVERSARILEHLEPEMIARIAREIAVMGKVPHQTQRAVLREFRALAHAQEQRESGMAFAGEVLDKALGPERATALLNEMKPSLSPAAPPLLTTLPPLQAVQVLTGEPPHIIALLLTALPEDCATAILLCLPPETRNAVCGHLAHTTPPSTGVLRHLDQALRAKARQISFPEEPDGDLDVEDTPPPEVAKEPDAGMVAEAPSVPVSSDMPTYSFFDLANLDRMLVKAVLARVESTQLCRALRGAEHEFQECLLASLPFSRRISLQNHLHAQKPITLREITEAQEQIARIACVVLGHFRTVCPAQKETRYA